MKSFNDKLIALRAASSHLQRARELLADLGLSELSLDVLDIGVDVAAALTDHVIANSAPTVAEQLS